MEAKQVTQWRTRRKKVNKVFFTLFFLCMHNSKEFIFNILLRLCCKLWTLKLPSCFRWFCCGSHLIIWCVCELRFTFLPDYLYMYFRFWRAHFFRSSRPEVFCKKGVLRNFAKFTGKHLCQSLFFNKVAGWDL